MAEGSTNGSAEGLEVKSVGAKSGDSKVTCPRCGLLGYRVIKERSSRKYVYVAHVSGEKMKWCYVGPLDGYSYVERLHSLDLTNVASQDYLEIASNAVQRYLEKSRSDESRTRALTKLLELIEDELELAKEFARGVPGEGLELAVEKAESIRTIASRLYSELYEKLMSYRLTKDLKALELLEKASRLRAS